MNEELNNLTFDNIKTTFSNNTNNLALSDELEASPLYQDKMGTNYSRSKMALRVFNFAGISLILTAAAIKTGSLLSNAYVLNPPSISNDSCLIEGHALKATFTISNPRLYKVECYLSIKRNNEELELLREDCSEEKEYLIEYSGLQTNDKGHFYIAFTNKVDYVKVIKTYEVNVEV